MNSLHLLRWSLMASIGIGILGCSSSSSSNVSESGWMPTEDACVYESAEPPLQRVVNYTNPALCNRPVPANRKVRKRLRDLYKE